MRSATIKVKQGSTAFEVVPNTDSAKIGDSFDNAIFALFTIALISVALVFTHKKRTVLNK